MQAKVVAVVTSKGGFVLFIFDDQVPVKDET